MKILFVLYSVLVIAGCTSKKELTREEAFKLLQQEKHYPKVIDYDISCSDPKAARKVLDAGLESAGLVTVQRTQKLGDIGKPLISFTEKAQPYPLETPEKDKARNVQKVKLADEELVEVAGVKTENEGKHAVVEYVTAYKNVTPFSALTTINLNERATRKARFSLYDDGWRLEK